MTGELARRVVGSSEQFDHSGRSATASVNFLTAHDGFTLQDTVTYTEKRNHANGEGNRDGKSENFSDNLGHEGPTDDLRIQAARDLRKRNMLATLFLSQGTPMLLAGDEFGNSQLGNNNAYAQDNPTGWLDWGAFDDKLYTFVQHLIQLRREHSVLRQKLFLHSKARRHDGLADLFWHKPDSSVPKPSDWNDPTWRSLCVEIRTSSDTPEYSASDDVLFTVFNRGEAQEVTLPPCPNGYVWEVILDTTKPDAGPHNPLGDHLFAPSNAVLALQRVAIRQEAE